MRDIEDDEEIASQHIHLPMPPSWPDIPRVPLSHQRRAWCLLQAEGLIPNVGGRDPQLVAIDMIRVADVFEAWLTNATVPHKLSIVEKV